MQGKESEHGAKFADGETQWLRMSEEREPTVTGLQRHHWVPTGRVGLKWVISHAGEVYMCGVRPG